MLNAEKVLAEVMVHWEKRFAEESVEDDPIFPIRPDAERRAWLEKIEPWAKLVRELDGKVPEPQMVYLSPTWADGGPVVHWHHAVSLNTAVAISFREGKPHMMSENLDDEWFCRFEDISTVERIQELVSRVENYQGRIFNGVSTKEEALELIARVEAYNNRISKGT